MTDINVSLNETVTAGVTNIGKDGKQGWADGFHVHLEIFRGKHATGAVNPVLVNQDLPTVCPYRISIIAFFPVLSRLFADSLPVFPYELTHLRSRVLPIFC